MSKHGLYKVAGGMMYIDVEESEAMKRRVEGTYEPEKTQAIMRLLQPNQTFVDVGANHGYFSLLASSIVQEWGRVIAFEPHYQNLYWLRASLGINKYKQCEVWQAAIGATNGRERLYFAEKSGHHSLARPTSRHTMVDLWMLDSAIDCKVDMIKIDVEGYELEALRGGREILTHNKDVVVLMDLHPKLGVDILKVCNLLRGLGFELFDMNENPLTVHPKLTELMARRV